MYKYLDRFNFLSKYYQRCHLFEYTCDDKTFQSIFDLSKLGSASVWMPGDVVAQRHVQGRHIVKLFVYGGEERYYETDRHGLVPDAIDFSFFTYRTSHFLAKLPPLFRSFCTTSCDSLVETVFQHEYQKRSKFPLSVTVTADGELSSVSWDAIVDYHLSFEKHMHRKKKTCPYPANVWIGDRIWESFVGFNRFDVVLCLAHCRNELISAGLEFETALSYIFGVTSDSFSMDWLVVDSRYQEKYASFLFLSVPLEEKDEVMRNLQDNSFLASVGISFKFGSRLDLKLPLVLSERRMKILDEEDSDYFSREKFDIFKRENSDVKSLELDALVKGFEDICPNVCLQERWDLYHHLFFADFVVAILTLDLPSYIILWITDWMPDFYPFPTIQRLRRIEKLQSNWHKLLAKRSPNRSKIGKTK
jgi:hypothetical protein